MRVLGIETSCDETAAAIYDTGAGLLAHRLHSQVEVHREYGGVVPELASRDHVAKLVPIVKRVVAEAGGAPVEGVAYTAGPGLAGALLVGAAAGRSLAFAWGVPAVGVHHLEAHLLAPMLEPDPPDYPFLALLVSGGHTQLVHVARPGKYEVLGRVPGRRGGRGIRQDRGAARSALSRRSLAGRPCARRRPLALSLSPPDDGSARTRHELQRPQDLRRHHLAQGGGGGLESRGHRTRLRGGGGRYPAHQVPPGAAGDRAAAPHRHRRSGRQSPPALGGGRPCRGAREWR